ncbi:MAG: hypothetical protein ACJ74C_10395 [Gaiellaceae bacterium]
MDHARRTLHEVDLSGPDGEQILREFELAALRNPERLSEARNQSELMRAAAELLVMAVEKVERDQEVGDAFADEAEDRSGDEREFTRASTRAAARRWRD